MTINTQQNGGTFTVNPAGVLFINEVAAPTLTLNAGAVAVGANATVIGTTAAGQLVLTNNAVLNNNFAASQIGSVNGQPILGGNAYLGFLAGSTGTASISSGSQWNVSGDLFVGTRGRGVLNIFNSGNVTSEEAFLANNAGSTGTANISSGGQWTVAGLRVGTSGTGYLNINQGGIVNGSFSYIGRNLDGVGTAVVTGVDSRWTLTSDLHIGFEGTGSLQVADGGRMAASWSHLGRTATAVGSALITGANSTWSLTGAGDLAVGERGRGTLTVANGGTVTSGYSWVGTFSTASGTGMITGAGSKWQANVLYVGDAGSGVINIENGGNLSTTTNFYLGASAGGNGTVNVSGAGSQLRAGANSFFIGNSGNGTLTVQNGGAVYGNTNNMYVANSAGSTGTVTVTGAGSLISLTGSAYIGGGPTAAGGTGRVAVGTGGTWNIGNTLKLWSTGTLTLDGGSVTARNYDRTSGNLVWNSGTLTISGGTYTHAVGTGQNANILNLSGTGSGTYQTLQIMNGATVAGVESIVVGGTGGGGLAVLGTTQWNVTGAIDVGLRAAASLEVGGGAELTTGTRVAVGGGVFDAQYTSVYQYSYQTGPWYAPVTVDVYSNEFTGYAGLSSVATATVSGSGSELNAVGRLNVGNLGQGTLTITAGGKVSASSALLGFGERVSGTGYFGPYSATLSGNGTVNVSGMGSELQVVGSMTIGLLAQPFQSSGVGALNISDGGIVSATRAIVAASPGSTGVVSVNSATWSLTDGLYLGGTPAGSGGAGSLTVSNGLVAVGGLTKVWSTGTLTVGVGGTLSTRTLEGNVTNHGTIRLAADGSVPNWSYGGVISGAGDVHVVSGTLQLNAAQSYSGRTELYSGTTLRLGGNNYLATTGYVQMLSENTTFDLNGYDQTLSSIDNSIILSFPGDVSTRRVTNNLAASTSRLTVGAGHFVGTIADGVGSVGLIVNATNGDFILHGDNTYSGGTTINPNANLVLAGGGSIVGHVTNNGRLSFEMQGDAAFGGVVSGTGTVEHAGAGTLVLTADNNFSGGTTIGRPFGFPPIAGTLQLGDGGTSGGVTGNISNYGTLALNRSNHITLAGIISGDGGVRQIGTGTTVLSGSNGYSGGTTVSAGTLVAQHDRSLGIGGAWVETGGTLDIAAGVTPTNALTLSGGTIRTHSFNPTVTPLTWNDGTLTLSGGTYTHAAGSGAAANVLKVSGATGHTAALELTHGASAVGVEAVLVGYNAEQDGRLLVSGGSVLSVQGSSINLAPGGQFSGTAVIRGTMVMARYGSDAAATVSGVNSMINLSGTLIVAEQGNATLSILDGGAVVTRTAILGAAGGSVGTVFVSGSGSRLTVSSAIASGSGLSTLTVTGGGVVNAASVVAPRLTVVSGPSSRLTSSTSLDISGGFSNSELRIENQASVASDSTRIGSFSAGAGTVVVSGAGSTFNIARGLFIGNNQGSLNITDAAAVVSGSATLAYQASTGTGVVSITGAGSSWQNAAQLIVGSIGTGTLNVHHGGNVSTSSAVVGRAATAVGTVSVLGAESRWTVTNDLHVAGETQSGGAGLIEIAQGGTVAVGGLTKIWERGSVTVGDGGTFTTGSLQVVSGGQFTVADGGHFTGAVQTAGEYVVNGMLAGNAVVQAGGTLGGSGVIAGNLSGAGTVAPGNSPGVLDAVQIDPTSGLDFLFEFTAANTLPDVLNRTASLNDVLHLTHTATPFLSALTSNNVVTVDFQVGSLADGDVFYGGFFTNTPGEDFYGDGSVQNAVYNYLLNGAVLDLNQWQVSVSTSPQFNVDFGADHGGIVDGRLMQFSLQHTAVPEPGSLLLAGTAAAAYYIRRNRKRRPSAVT